MKGKNIQSDYDAVFDVNDYLYFYEDHITKEITDKQIEFLQKYLEIKKEMKILDLACGHGRHTNRLTAKGYNVIGLDKSAGFLKEANIRAEKLNVSPKYIQADMRNLFFEENLIEYCCFILPLVILAT